MLLNYIKIAWRNLLKNPIYSLINIGGLMIGIACCLLILQYVTFEYSFDSFNEKAGNLYRVNETNLENAADSHTSPTMVYAMGTAVAHEIPEVVHFARLHPEYNNAVVSNPRQPEKVFDEENVFYADSAFFKMFSYPLKAGNVNHVLEPGTVLISQSTARKYFGDENPVGQFLKVTGWIKGTYRVNGIFRDVPANSHLQFDILLPMADLLQKSYNDPLDAWNWENFITYVQLCKDADLSEVEHKFTAVLRRHLKKTFGQIQAKEQVDLQPLLNIHLNDEIVAPKTAMGSFRTVYFYMVIGLIILLIALVNYINLTTARAMNRSREVGVRKSIGAQKGHLILQFICESALTISVATVLAVILAEWILPILNKITGETLTYAMWSRPDFWIGLTMFFGITVLLASLYPAFILSSFRPVQVLKGKFGKSSKSSIWLRRSLVIFQFTAAIVLMGLGLDLEHILTVRGPRVLPKDVDRKKSIETFTQELKRFPGVRQITTSGSLPGQGFEFSTVIHNEMNPSKEITAAGVHVDTSFAAVYGLKLLVGKGFSTLSISNSKEKLRPVIVSETAAHAAGFNKPANILGKDLFTGRVVGVFKDFKWSSAHEKRKNIFFVLGEGNRFLSIKTGTQDLSETIARIEDLYKQFFPGNPFLYAFADKQFNQQYQSDERFARLFTFFAGLAIAIACMGLFGLAAFTTEQRTKEIGIRKILGASVSGIITLLSKDYLKLVGIGCVIAVPISWYVMHRWLQDYAYHTNIGIGTFALAGVWAFVIALATVSWQSVRAALTNPVESLRNE